MKSRELPLDRLATTDEKGNRIYLYPADVRGRYRTLRTRLNAILVLIFLLLPWTRINHHQTILLDIPQRRFALFGITFWAHDAPMLLFIFCGAALSLALVTALWGRIWCGWACPQTVFIDSVFRRIEHWIEGDAIERRKLDSTPLNFEKFGKKSLKWGLFTLSSMVISHSFIAYFVGTEALAKMVRSSPSENMASFLVMSGVTALILFDFGWFREQFCTLVCPYGRFQSVLMDDQSTVVAYDAKRGEPRRGIQPSSELNGDLSSQGSSGPVGDCVNCYRCVQVCPTGIDIRRGVQLECIACTACMDACDDVMSRLKKPQKLIRYNSYGSTLSTSQSTLQGPSLNTSLNTSPSSTFAVSQKKTPFYQRGRVLACGALLLFCAIGLGISLFNRTPLEVALIRATDAPYQEIKNTEGKVEIINHFKVDLRNQTFENQKISFMLGSEKRAKIVVSNHPPILNAGEVERADLFVQFPKELLHFGHAVIPILIRGESESDASHLIEISKEVKTVGPLQ